MTGTSSRTHAGETFKRAEPRVAAVESRGYICCKTLIVKKLE
jgi:hypothetical protein